MANIRVDLNHAPLDGEAVTFKAPCDASEITGLVIYYDGVSKAFTLTDANGNDIGVLDNIFAEGAIVKAILDTDGNKAFVQNPNTNTYLESKFDTKAPAGYGLGSGLLPKVNHEQLDKLVSAGWAIFHDVNNPLWEGQLSVALVHTTGMNHDVTNAWAQEFFVFPSRSEPWYKLQRHLRDGVWKPLEWENPPMKLGVEYRTTERSEGKPVYAKRISYTPTEALTGVMVQSVPHNISEFGTLVRAFGKSKTFPLPYLMEGSKYTSILDVNNYAIRLQTYNVNWDTTYTWVFDLYYTKTTD